jgi:hypothetical protein
MPLRERASGARYQVRLEPRGDALVGKSELHVDSPGPFPGRVGILTRVVSFNSFDNVRSQAHVGGWKN